MCLISFLIHADSTSMCRVRSFQSTIRTNKNIFFVLFIIVVDFFLQRMTSLTVNVIRLLLLAINEKHSSSVILSRLIN